MGTVKYIGRIGALAVALGVGNVRRTATRMTVSIGVAVLVVMATVVPAPTVSPAVRLGRRPPCTDTDVTCALIMGGTTVPTPDDAYVETVMNQFIAPTHPDQDIELRRGDHARGGLAHHRDFAPRRARARASEHLGAWWRSVAGRAVVETLGALRPHLRSVGPGRGGRSGGGDGRSTATTIW